MQRQSGCLPFVGLLALVSAVLFFDRKETQLQCDGRFLYQEGPEINSYPRARLGIRIKRLGLSYFWINNKSTVNYKIFYFDKKYQNQKYEGPIWQKDWKISRNNDQLFVIWEDGNNLTSIIYDQLSNSAEVSYYVGEDLRFKFAGLC